MTIQNGDQLNLDRCPHCGIAKPSLNHAYDTKHKKAYWCLYLCQTCDGAVLTKSLHGMGNVEEIYPAPFSISEAIPQRAREYLTQAAASLHAPAGAVMLTASAIDAMLKDKNYKDGSLNSRINQAAKDHLITAEMSEWAHEVRLEANDQRHADDLAAFPDQADAVKVLEFAQALGQFLYVLPARVEAGRNLKSKTKARPTHSATTPIAAPAIVFPGQ